MLLRTLFQKKKQIFCGVVPNFCRSYSSSGEGLRKAAPITQRRELSVTRRPAQFYESLRRCPTSSNSNNAVQQLMLPMSNCQDTVFCHRTSMMAPVICGSARSVTSDALPSIRSRRGVYNSIVNKFKTHALTDSCVVLKH